jgi:hypothetical protein
MLTVPTGVCTAYRAQIQGQSQLHDWYKVGSQQQHQFQPRILRYKEVQVAKTNASPKT